MVKYRCDGCGKEMGAQELRYTASIEVKAAYDEIEVSLMDLMRDHRQEILRLIEQMRQADPKLLEDQIFKRISLDLCPSCQRAFVQAPLRFHPEQVGAEPVVDIDSFLRSLGLGETK